MAHPMGYGNHMIVTIVKMAPKQTKQFAIVTKATTTATKASTKATTKTIMTANNHEQQQHHGDGASINSNGICTESNGHPHLSGLYLQASVGMFHFILLSLRSLQQQSYMQGLVEYLVLGFFFLFPVSACKNAAASAPVHNDVLADCTQY